MPLPFLAPLANYKLLFQLLAIASLAAGLFGGGYYAGSMSAQDKLIKQAMESQALIDTIQRELEVATAKANTVAEKNSELLSQIVDIRTEQLIKENQNARKNPENLKPLNLPGIVVGLRSNTQNKCISDTGNGLQANSNPGIASGIGDQATCQLDTETQRALREITRDGDEAIRQLNALIDTYNKVKEVGCSVSSVAADNSTEIKTGI
jgi:hypothetical protein